jgi:phosphoadenosine phosphosulfate reductase
MLNSLIETVQSDTWDPSAIELANSKLESMSSVQRIEWALDNLPKNFALSSSFGIQSAVSLHMVTKVYPEIPVIVIDTGYLFPETYQFIELLTDKLKLNLKVYSAQKSSAWQEATLGKLWQQGEQALTEYNQRNKVLPMELGLQELGINAYFSGIMRSQSSSRTNIPALQKIRGRLKVHPIIDWNKRMVHQYLTKYRLPYHPLWDKGYVSVGDVHSTSPLLAGMSDEETRFGGVKRECGLHEDTLSGL